MPGEPTNEREVFLSTLPAGRGERRRALAVVLRRLDIPPRKRYSWEVGEGEQGDSDARGSNQG